MKFDCAVRYHPDRTPTLPDWQLPVKVTQMLEQACHLISLTRGYQPVHVPDHVQDPGHVQTAPQTEHDPEEDDLEEDDPDELVDSLATLSV